MIKLVELKYKTRDVDGKEFIKNVKLKEYPIENVNFECKICKRKKEKGIQTKKVVSSKFTDYAYIGDYICEDCSRLFSLYFYNYIVDNDGIRLMNIRQIKEEICKPQKTPFRFCITTTQKKHLFYRSVLNESNKKFAVNLETETIYTTCERMKELFTFVECLLSLGASKKYMCGGLIPLEVTNKTGKWVIDALDEELRKSREIQIPLFCGQKLEESEEKIICIMDSIRTKRRGERQR